MPSMLSAAVKAGNLACWLHSIFSHMDNRVSENCLSCSPQTCWYFGRDLDSPQKAYQTLIFLRLQMLGVKVAFTSVLS